MKIALASSSQVAIPILEWMLAEGLTPTLISSPDKPTGRGRELSANLFTQHCRKLGLNVFSPATDEEIRELIKLEGIELVVTVAYGKLIKKEELSMPKHGWINVHFSLLPQWRGAAPVQYAILNGDAQTGVTVFKLDVGMDTGPVYTQDVFPISGDATAESLLLKLSQAAVSTLERAIQMINKGVLPNPQPADQISYAPKISKSDGEINWHDSALNIDRKIRAFTPWPNAWTKLHGKRIVITSAKICANSELRNGVETQDVGQVINHEGVFVSCGNGWLEIVRVKPEGKREMSSAEWIRGLQQQEDIKFGSQT